MKRRILAFAVAVLAVVLALAWFYLDYGRKPRPVTGPMVQMVTPDGFDLIWTPHPSPPCRVAVFGQDGTERGSFPAEPDEGGQLIAHVTGLEAGTAYRYQVIADGEGGKDRVLAEHPVRTAPLAGTPCRFVAFGDTGVGKRSQWLVARQIATFDPDLIVHTGDIVYPRGEREDYPAKFYRPYARLIAHIPMYPCLGNHELRTDDGMPALEAFVLPRNGPESVQPERHFWFDYGDIRFVAIDSNFDYPHYRDLVAPWLDKVLTEAGSRWKVLFWHEPIYTHGKYEPAEKMRKAILPIVDKHHVEFVLHGHNHMYERSFPIRADRIVPDGEGTVYVTTGAGGANIYDFKMPPPDYLVTFCDSVHSFTVIDVSDRSMAVRQIDENGGLIDEFQIPRYAPALTSGNSPSQSQPE